MPDVQPTMDDEIDLFDLFEILWIEKVVLGCFLAVALVVGSLWTIIQEPKYETIAEVDIIFFPPSVTKEKVIADLRKEFHSNETYSQWAETVPNAKLQSEDVYPTIVLNGATFSVDIDEKALVLVQSDKIKIRSNDTGLILDAVDYTQFVFDALSEKYAERSKEEYDRLMALSDRLYERRDRGSLPATFNGLPALERLSELDSYLSRVGGGLEPLSVNLPSEPINVGFSKSSMFAVSMMTGGVSGVLFVLSRNAYRQRKSKKAALVN